jgi:anaerobic selenocysteine-containing dehydrogenase
MPDCLSTLLLVTFCGIGNIKDMKLFELDELAQIIDPKAWNARKYQLERADEYARAEANYRKNHPEERGAGGWEYRRIEWERIADDTVAQSRLMASRVIPAIEEKLNDWNKT